MWLHRGADAKDRGTGAGGSSIAKEERKPGCGARLRRAGPASAPVFFALGQRLGATYVDPEVDAAGLEARATSGQSG